MTTPVMQSSPSVADLVAYHAKLRARPKRVTWIEVPFADGIYRFALPLTQINELEETLGHIDRHGARIPMGIGAIFGRLAKGRSFLANGDPDWSAVAEAEALASEIVARDCIEIIRLGLIGGNRAIIDDTIFTVTPKRAMQLINAYVVGQPLEDAWHYAFAILGALIYGVELPPALAEDEG